MDFKTLASINVNDKIEKKNGFSYLSWAYAHAKMAELDPDFDWWPHDFNGLPYLETPGGCMVKVTVRFGGKEKTHLFPVLDHRNKPIATPTVFDINTSIMRAMVKCCALFGLGLYIYAGEDLPNGSAAKVDDEGEAFTEAEQRTIASFVQQIRDTLAADVDENDKMAALVAIHYELNEQQRIYIATAKALGDDKNAFKKWVQAGLKAERKAA